jgi:hypothetical protein
LNVHCELHSGKRVSVRPAPAPPTQLNSSHARTRHRLKPLLALNRYSSAHLFHLLSTWPSTQYLTPSRSNNLIMSLTIVPRRVALRSATRSTPWARQFSTVVDDTFSPVAPASAPPPPPPQARKGRVLELRALTGQRMRSGRFTTRRSWSWLSKRYEDLCGHLLW